MKKRFLAILLCLCLVLMLFPATAFAEETYTFTFKFDRGTLHLGDEVITTSPYVLTVSRGETFKFGSIMDCPEPYGFSGWYRGGNVYHPGGSIMAFSNATFEAQYDVQGSININGANMVCAQQDYEFTVTATKGVTCTEFTYGDTGRGTLTLKDGVLSGTVPAEFYSDKDSFDLTVSGTVSDGNETSPVGAAKTVQVSTDHVFDEHGVCGCGAKQLTITYQYDYGTLPEDQENPETIINEPSGTSTSIWLPDLEDCGERQFLGWQILGSDDIDVYPAGAEYVPAEDMTFVAVYDEYATLTAPFTTTVTQSDNCVPGETVFSLAVVGANAGEESYADVTVSGAVTTDGEGVYNGAMTFTGPFGQLRNMLCEGAFVQQVDAGEDGWIYDDTVFGLLLTEDFDPASMDDMAPEYTLRILPASCIETGDGVYYDLDWNAAPLDAMQFANVYTAHDHEYTQKYDETNHWDECDCGDIQNEEAHKYGAWTVTKEPTETEEGEKEHTCTVCDYTETETIPVLEHTHEYTLMSDETHHWDECECGDIQNEEAHKYGAWTVTKEPTETEEGEQEHTCTVCDYTESETIPVLGHTHKYTRQCDENSHWDECECGDIQNREIHQYGAWTVTKEPTETEEGEKEHACTGCGYKQIEVIPALGHSHEYTQRYDATSHWDECQCGDIQNKEAHKYGAWTVKKAPTETEEGEQEHSCTVCSYKETVKIPKLTKPGTPDTGDDSNLTLWFALLAVSAAGLIVLYGKKKRRNAA